jgi:hypothetical protein
MACDGMVIIRAGKVFHDDGVWMKKRKSFAWLHQRSVIPPSLVWGLLSSSCWRKLDSCKSLPALPIQPSEDVRHHETWSGPITWKMGCVPWTSKLGLTFDESPILVWLYVSAERIGRIINRDWWYIQALVSSHSIRETSHSDNLT